MRFNTRERDITDMSHKVSEKVVLEHLQVMRKDEMDHKTIQNVFNLIKNRRFENNHRLARQCNETYFCELIDILFERAREKSSDQ